MFHACSFLYLVLQILKRNVVFFIPPEPREGELGDVLFYFGFNYPWRRRLTEVEEGARLVL